MVTVPADLLTVPAEAAAMLSAKAGRSKITGPGALPVTLRPMVLPCPVIVTPIRRPSAAGKPGTAIGRPEVSQLPGTPRPTISAPSACWDTRESSRPRSPMAMPQECGDEPPPDDGWFPAHGVVLLGEVEPSHQAYGPLWSLAIMNSQARMPSSR